MFVKNNGGKTNRNNDNFSFFKPNTVFPKLNINPGADSHFQKSGSIAANPFNSVNIQKIQRKCHECTEEDKKLQLKEKNSNAVNNSNAEGGLEPTPNFQKQLIASKGGGTPLPDKTNSFMSQAIGSDFSQVSIHTGNQAQEMNQSIRAKAFTHGSDIYFNKGQYNPSSNQGKKLLAHELTHVVQQRGAAIQKKPDSSMIQLMRLGQGNPPTQFNQFNGRTVPADEQDRVNEAIDKIREVVNDPDQYSSCHHYFRDECPTQGRNSLPQMFNNAILWRADNPGAHAFTWANYNHIAYTESGYNSGATGLARTLVHELLHNCGITGNDRHHQADVAGLYCIGSDNEFSFSAGPAFGGTDMMFFLIGYRRLLANLAGGQIQLRAGADINVTGVTAEIASAAIGGSDLVSGEFGSLSIGMLGRSNIGWGGERFGGITANLDLGIDVGRFRVRESTATDENNEILPGFVLQAGLGAEFYLPIGVNALPMSIGATYRMIRPLNSEAEMVHGLLGQIGLTF